ncbi:MAG: hypothetical protein KAT76_01635 [Bacteroidales bacterium]|nr:hypothetical protein [Bacteroidales bacterium]
MKKLTSIITIILLALAVVSCGKKGKIDTSKASAEVKNAIEASYQLSKKLTDMQLEAGKDNVLDAEEIEAIGKVFERLAIINNLNIKRYARDKYFIALRKEYKDKYDVLADTVVFLKDCEGYDQLGLSIQKISIEVRDDTLLKTIEPEVIEIPDTMPGDEPEGIEPE